MKIVRKVSGQSFCRLSFAEARLIKKIASFGFKKFSFFSLDDCLQTSMVGLRLGWGEMAEIWVH